MEEAARVVEGWCSMREIWEHHCGYGEARRKVEEQSLEDDLGLIDSLFGRDNLSYGDGPAEVKAEALRQLEVEWRSERNERAEFYLGLFQTMRKP